MSEIMDKFERDAYNEMDRNCNACKHLIRVSSAPHGKPWHLWTGKCDAGIPDLPQHPYKDDIKDGVFYFHPNDWMGMKCWEPRG